MKTNNLANLQGPSMPAENNTPRLLFLLRILTLIAAIPIACFLSLFCLLMVAGGAANFSLLGILWGLAGLAGTYGLFLAAIGIHPLRASLCMFAGMAAMFPLVLNLELTFQWIAAPFWIALLHQFAYLLPLLRRRPA